MIRLALLPIVLALSLLALPSSAAAAKCDDYTNQADAQRAKDTRDADGDGVYCESLPCPCLKPGSGDRGGRGGDRAARRRAAARRKAAAKRKRYSRFNQSSWRISSVVDGDTIRVKKLSGPAPVQFITVRVIGIDTPETKKPGVPVECGGKEAVSAMLFGAFTAPADTDGDGLLDTEGGDGRRAKLTTDRSQDLYDRYGRLLAYVTAAGTDLGRGMIAAGWADIYVFDRDFARVRSYREAASEAKATSKGVHGACAGDFHSEQ